mmetsp:Transcript_72862/g.230197  ORF Transcript_72862/g.230197 Transcript_72862/m.230197 type:complete len:247 (+) Transcript_72862:304-1044(+)
MSLSAVAACSLSMASSMPRQALPMLWLSTKAAAVCCCSSSFAPAFCGISSSSAPAPGWFAAAASKPANTARAPSWTASLVFARRTVGPWPAIAAESSSSASQMLAIVFVTVLPRPSMPLLQAPSKMPQTWEQHSDTVSTAAGMACAHPQAASLLAQSVRQAMGSARHSPQVSGQAALPLKLARKPSRLVLTHSLISDICHCSAPAGLRSAEVKSRTADCFMAANPSQPGRRARGRGRFGREAARAA